MENESQCTFITQTGTRCLRRSCEGTAICFLHTKFAGLPTCQYIGRTGAVCGKVVSRKHPDGEPPRCKAHLGRDGFKVCEVSGCANLYNSCGKYRMCLPHAQKERMRVYHAECVDRKQTLQATKEEVPNKEELLADALALEKARVAELEAELAALKVTAAMGSARRRP